MFKYIKNISNYGGKKLLGYIKNLPVFKILYLSVLSAVFLGSILLNNCLLSHTDDVSKTSIDNFHPILIIGLLLITSISLGISFWMYYVRSIYVKDGPALVPEKWGAIINELVSSSQKSDKQAHEILTKVLRSSVEQSEKSESLLTNFLTLQKTLNEKDEEISRLKKGYDSKIFKRFLMRFIRVNSRVDRTLTEFTDESKGSIEVKNYTDISRMLHDALEECGVEPFNPEIGADLRDMGSEVGENPTPVSTDREEDDFKIASIESIGYIIKGEVETEVIVPAKVSIFRFDK